MSKTNRRGFLASLRDTLISRNEGDPFFFGFQAVINVYGEDELRRNIHRIISEAPATEHAQDKKLYYRRISALLFDHVPSIEYGFWEYLTDPEDAVAEFDSWVDEIESGAAIVEEETSTEADEEFRLSSEKDYIVVTPMFLLEHGRFHEDLAQRLKGINEEDEYTPIAFQQLVQGINDINFERCLADGMYLLPGSAEDGFSWTDMRAPGWDYLQPVMGRL